MARKASNEYTATIGFEAIANGQHATDESRLSKLIEKIREKRPSNLKFP